MICLALASAALAIPPRTGALAPLRLDAEFYGVSVPSAYLKQSLGSQIAAGEAAWQTATGAGVIVALIDNGVDPFNPALRDALLGSQGWNFYDNSANWSAWSELAPNGQPLGGVLKAIASSGTCPFIQPAPLKANIILNGITEPFDSDQDSTGEVLALMTKLEKCEPGFGHGTAVAGLIHLVAPQAKILPINAFGPNGRATPAAIAAAIRYAIARHANVINLSFTSPQRYAVIEAAVAAAQAHGIVVVTAAGNSATDAPFYPAALPDVLSVGAIDGCGAAAPAPCLANPFLLRAGFSNYDPPAGILDADVAAPGVRLLTTFPGFGLIWAESTGTSFSAALVSGEAALLVQLGQSRADIVNEIEGTADPAIPGDADGSLGHGLIQILGALRLAH